jgi:hypothetical protein
LSGANHNPVLAFVKPFNNPTGIFGPGDADRSVYYRVQWAYVFIWIFAHVIYLPYLGPIRLWPLLLRCIKKNHQCSWVHLIKSKRKSQGFENKFLSLDIAALYHYNIILKKDYDRGNRDECNIDCCCWIDQAKP